EKRRGAAPKPGIPRGWQAVNPAFPNPWRMFEGFPSALLKPDDRLQIMMGANGIAGIMKHDMNFFLPDLLVPKEAMIDLVEAIRRAGAPFMRDILAPFPPAEHDRLWRCIGWMLKHGVAVKI